MGDKMQGIVSYGAYIPRFKIETGEIASVWGADGSAWANNLNVYSKSVPGPDEDVITISVEAARKSLNDLMGPGKMAGYWLVPGTDTIGSFAPFNNVPTHYRITVEGQSKWWGQ